MKSTKRYLSALVGLLILVIIYGVFSLTKVPSMSDNVLYSVNYTGLPEGEDVRIYPESHIITDNKFKIVFENNRDKALYWGQEWKAERWVNGKWVYWNPDWIWTSLQCYTEPQSTNVTTERFPFRDGLYRITKRCMLTDNYDREKKEWVDEFTVTFYLVKES